jgi:dTMP kinase
MKRGAFILFEGVDRCGKTTQTNRLLQNLKDRNAKVSLRRFPSSKPCTETTIGKIINSYLSNESNLEDRSIHLLFSADRWECKEDIENTLASGETILVDRYAYSGVAFTAAKGYDLEWCKSCDLGLPAPDKVIYLSMPIEETSKRGNFGEQRYEKVEFQKKVKKIFDEQLCEPSWSILNAQRTIEELETQILQIAERTIAEAELKPIEKLWLKNK